MPFVLARRLPGRAAPNKKNTSSATFPNLVRRGSGATACKPDAQGRAVTFSTTAPPHLNRSPPRRYNSGLSVAKQLLAHPARAPARRVAEFNSDQTTRIDAAMRTQRQLTQRGAKRRTTHNRIRRREAPRRTRAAAHNAGRRLRSQPLAALAIAATAPMTPRDAPTTFKYSPQHSGAGALNMPHKRARRL